MPIMIGVKCDVFFSDWAYTAVKKFSNTYAKLTDSFIFVKIIVLLWQVSTLRDWLLRNMYFHGTIQPPARIM